MTPFERALVAHFVADWLLQNSWMAMYKTSLRHPASWVHAAIYAICLGMALDPVAGAGLGFIHLLVDTRVPLAWWVRVFKKCEDSDQADSILMWTDQAIHIVTLGVWLAFFPAK